MAGVYIRVTLNLEGYDFSLLSTWFFRLCQNILSNSFNSSLNPYSSTSWITTTSFDTSWHQWSVHLVIRYLVCTFLVVPLGNPFCATSESACVFLKKMWLQQRSQGHDSQKWSKQEGKFWDCNSWIARIHCDQFLDTPCYNLLLRSGAMNLDNCQ